MFVKSAKRTMEILELLTEYSEGLTIKEVSDKLSIPQSSTFNLIHTLFSDGYLINVDSSKYKLGPKLIRIGSTALESFDLESDSRPHLNELMNSVGETVFMARISNEELIYIAKVKSNRSVTTSADIGSSRPLYCTGLGKAFLAFLPDKKRIK